MAKKRNYITAFLILISIVFTAVQIVILNQNSTAGENLTKILREVKQTEQENSKLNQQIASYSALATIYQKAQALGFDRSQKVISFTSSLPLAFLEDSSL